MNIRITDDPTAPHGVRYDIQGVTTNPEAADGKELILRDQKTGEVILHIEGIAA